jgi:hypothetical protein
MAKFKRKGIVAVPGEYKYGEVTEIKTAEELKSAAERHPNIPITYKHPVEVYPKASEIIGTLQQKWDEKNQRINGEFWFHDEKISEELEMKLMNNEILPVSGGILIDDIEDNIQKGIVFTHMAILGEGDDPVCPLGTCGVNMRMESNPTLNVRFEQSTDLEPPEEEPKVAPEPEVSEEPDVVETETIEEETPETEEPAEENPEDEVEEPVEEEVVLVPEVEIPVGEVVSDELETDERGYYVFYPHKD